MCKRLGGLIPVVLLVIFLGSWGTPTPIQAQNAVRVLAVESAQAAVEAWAAAVSRTEDITIDLHYVESAEAVRAGVGSADILVYDEFEALPGELGCGVLSRAWALLPDLGARYVDRSRCSAGDADPAVLKALVRFMASPDGQQIAIDLDLLPAVVEVVDQAGITVEVPQPVRRIVSACEAGAFYVYTIGAEDRLVAASQHGPETIRESVPVLIRDEADLAAVAELHPDLILASSRSQWRYAALDLEVPVLCFEGETPDGLKNAVSLLGSVLGPDAAYRAAQFNAYYDATLAQIRAQTAAVEKPFRVYFSGTEALRTIGGRAYQTAMIEAAGGESVSVGLPRLWNDVTLEQVLAWNPDVILVPAYSDTGLETITGSDIWASLPAVRAGRVYRLPPFISSWDVLLPDSILGIIWMAETLYPEQVELDCAAQVTYFYDMFYDDAITSDEAQALCG